MTDALHPFTNPDLPVDKRLDDLIARLTLEEKISLMPQYQAEIPRLGIPAYKHGTEAAHGIAWLGKATAFPQPIGLGCTWNAGLMREIGRVIGTEARAFYKRDPKINGLTLWAPTVDMERDPRWGRTEEAYGEDPHLTGRLAIGLIRGIQGDHPFYFRAVATLKHFLANNNEVDRGFCSASIDPRNMHEYYLEAFRPAFVEGGARSMMTAYNSVNGKPAILHPYVREIVKGTWGMDGFIVSDAVDMTGLVRDHHYLETYAEAVALSIKNGIDSITDDADTTCGAIREALDKGLLEEADLDRALRNTFGVRLRLGEFDPQERNPYAAIDESAIASPEHLDVARRAARESLVLLKNDRATLPLAADALTRVAVVGPLADEAYRDWYSGSYPYKITPLEGIRAKLPGTTVSYHSGNDCVELRSEEDGRRLAVADAETGTLAATGAADGDGNAEAARFELSDWGGGNYTLRSRLNGKYVTGDERISASADEVYGWYVKEIFRLNPDSGEPAHIRTWNGKLVGAGENGSGPLHAVADDESVLPLRFAVNKVEDGLQRALEAAAGADAAVVFVGNHPLVNGKEEIDRKDLSLSPAQERLVRETCRVNPQTILVIVGSYPFALNGLEDLVPAILYTSHAGPDIGAAIADALFGDYAPAGRLNMTWYRSTDALPPIKDYDIIRGKRTYQYYDGEPLYPFGHGLTYSAFEYFGMTASLDGASDDDAVRIRFTLRNGGRRDSDEVVQLYVQALDSRVKRPLKQLKGFQRVPLRAGESRELVFEVPLRELAFWDVTRNRPCRESGRYRFMIGASSADIRLIQTLPIPGETIPPRNPAAPTFADAFDDCHGTYLDEGPNDGTCVRPTGETAWLKYGDIAFASAPSSFEAEAASKAGGVLEVRLDRPDGPLAAAVTVGGAEEGRWQRLRSPASRVVGTHDCYLKLIGDVRLSRFRFE